MKTITLIGWLTEKNISYHNQAYWGNKAAAYTLFQLLRRHLHGLKSLVILFRDLNCSPFNTILPNMPAKELLSSTYFRSKRFVLTFLKTSFQCVQLNGPMSEWCFGSNSLLKFCFSPCGARLTLGCSLHADKGLSDIHEGSTVRRISH